MIKSKAEITTEDNVILLDKVTPLRAAKKDIENNLAQRLKCSMNDSGQQNCIQTHIPRKGSEKINTGRFRICVQVRILIYYQLTLKI